MHNLALAALLGNQIFQNWKIPNLGGFKVFEGFKDLKDLKVLNDLNDPKNLKVIFDNLSKSPEYFAKNVGVFKISQASNTF
ncbi:hypothetical protein M2480_003102 [Parabacteroides sp. PFB2-12]|nr:hypothetical protein [Parabacteroides sp. PM6-13]MDH6392094.1 hypothetical protein [Parabacteroides sp. PFB2-12]